MEVATKSDRWGSEDGGGSEKSDVYEVKIEKGDDEKKKLVNEAVPFTTLLSYADGLDWLLMALGTLGSIVHGMALPVGYLLLGKALDAYGNNFNSNTDDMVRALYKVVPYVWYMAIATFPAGIMEIGCWMYASERQMARMRLSYLKSVLNQEIGAFDTDMTSGKIITGISNQMSIIQDAIGEKMGHFFASLATFFAGIVIAIICTWQVSLLAFLVVPMIMLIGATYTKKMNTVSGVKMIYLSEATSMVEQTISQIKTVFAFAGEVRAVRAFTECMAKQVDMSRREALIKGVGTGLFQTVTFCSWAVIIWIGAVVVTRHQAKGGDVIAAVMSILFGAISLTYAAPDLQIFSQAKTAGAEVFKVINRKPKISYDTAGKMLDRVEGNIELRDVHFVYPSRKDTPILRGFSLSIPSGKMVALVGSSGCGKSTVISLVSRFYDPSKGDVLIDNHNIKELDLKFLRKNVGTVSQEPCLFTGTIMDNLKVGKMDAGDLQIKKASEMANAHSFISLLPEKYSTEVGQRGFQLSGGQKQRIAIARAILKDPPILLLDEATSALDSESEKLVQDALEKAMQGRTVIMIAHRMSTIVNADIIAVVQDGRVTETGSHRSLLDSSVFYKNLFAMQTLTPTLDPSDKSAGPDEPESGNKLKIMQDIEHLDISIDTSSHFSQTVNIEEPKERNQMDIFLRLWFGLQKREFLKIAVGSCAAAISGISKPFFGFFIITVGVAYYKPHAREKVGFYSIIFASIGMLAMFTHTLQHYFYGIVGEKAMINLRQALYSGVLRNELAWFEKPENSVGSLTSRIIHDTSMVKTIISDRMAVIVQCVSSILIATIVSMCVSWRMGLVAWAVMPCHFIGGLVQAKSSKGFAGDSVAAHSEVIALASESAANIRTVASFCYEETILKKAKICLDVPKKKSRMLSLKYGVIQGVSILLWNVAHAVALWYTTVLVDRHQATFENGIRSYQIFSLTIPSITELYTLLPTVIAAINVLTPAFETLDRETEINPDGIDETGIERITGRVEFRKVKFNYPLRPEVTVLNKFSLQIEAGTKMALVGPSGAGKSSVLALLLRFYDPRKGAILVDGKDIREYNLKRLRTQIGLVQQEPLLFSSSIRDNILYGNEAASEVEIVKVSREANIYEFISNLPDGYDTVVGEKGCQLSGGQKQRIAIARTLLKRPAILLLDEATSALDAESERSVVSALEAINLGGDGGSLFRATQITVAHRLSTVKNSDTIVVMDKGEIVEMGSHTALKSSDGVYSRLCQIQNMTQK